MKQAKHRPLGNSSNANNKAVELELLNHLNIKLILFFLSLVS